MVTHIAGHREKLNEILEATADNPEFAESFQAVTAALIALASEDEGWAPIAQLGVDDQFALHNIQLIARTAELQSLNPLLKRGLALRTENVFSRGMQIEGTIPPRFKAILAKPLNARYLIEAEGFTQNERSLYITGHLFMAYDIRNQEFFPIPFREITNNASNPRVHSEIQYYQHTYYEVDPVTGKPLTNPTVEWYPVLERWEQRATKPLPTKIFSEPFNSNIVIVDLLVNRSIGQVWGIPDVLAAMPYAWGHAEYIRDAAKLLKALSTIAWKVVTKSKGNAANAATKFAQGKRSASTAVMTEGSDLQSVPRSGQVDMSDGNALAGYVASALGVSLIALLADPGTASGSYGAAATLDGPSANTARMRQGLWVGFYNRIFRLLGVKDVTVSFPKISEDPIFRQVQTLTLARATGGLWADEYRGAVLAAMDVVASEAHGATPPPIDEYAQAQNALGYLQNEAQQQEAAATLKSQAKIAASSPVSAQGKSGAVGSLSSGDNSTRDQARTPGTSSV